MTAGPNLPRKKLPSAARLHASREFQRVYKHGVRASGAWMTVVVLRTQAPSGVRLGLSVSKDHGSAVRRNKIKRLLREAFRHERHVFEGDLDVVLIPKQNEAHATLPELRVEVVRLVQKALTQNRRNATRDRDAGERPKSGRSQPARQGKKQP